MKLSEALIIRADLQKNIAQLEVRLQANAQIQEGGVLAEKPEELFAKLRKVLVEFEDLVQKINYTNTVSKDTDGKSISQLIVKRDVMDTEIKMMRQFLDKASNLIQPYTKTEIRNLSSVDVSSYRKSLDDLSKKRRELEAKIQELNWTTELV
jgi:uncharacterized coiled-coil DUF342 family protein